MKTSNLLLDNYIIEKLSFTLNDEFEGFEEESSEPSLDVRCNYTNVGGETLKRKCEVEIALTESSAGSFPYYFDIVMAGHFRLNPDLDAEIAEKLFRVNAPALLYGTAREIIFNISSHSEHQAFLLPSVTFIDEDLTSADNKAKRTAKKTKKTKAKK